MGAPGQQKLWLEVRKRKIQATRSQVDAFVTKQGERQVDAQPLPQAKGKTASEDVNARYMLDVVFIRDLIVVFLVNVFTRNTWGKTVPNKSAASVGAAGKVLIDRLEEPPKVVQPTMGTSTPSWRRTSRTRGLGTRLVSRIVT